MPPIWISAVRSRPVHATRRIAPAETVFLARCGAQQHVQPADRMGIIFTLSTHITNPGGKVWHRDELIIQPGKIGEIF
jgi:hypothetical protein